MELDGNSGADLIDFEDYDKVDCPQSTGYIFEIDNLEPGLIIFCSFATVALLQTFELFPVENRYEGMKKK